uniref:CCHC-type domain-containing protein n=1 Tax=Tanacetum cinerariifolium TaxID=118510 RepID=A0A6L2M5C9_TANCI|nr:hypothetical protein [Tanacetum cinerariifolium]
MWEVIEFGDSYVVPANDSSTTTTNTTSGEKSGRTVTLTTEDMQRKKNDVKARTTLLLSLPDEHQLRFMKHNRVNDEVNTASVYTASSNVPTTSANIATVSISQETACAYIASQSSGSQIKFEDINQIDDDDMEDMDIKWNMALLSMRSDKFWKKTRKKISIQGSDVAGFDKSKVKRFNCHKMGHFVRECRAPRNQDRGRRDTYRQGSKAEEQAPKALMAIDGVGWDWSYMANDEEDHALVADEEAPTEFALMANTSTKSKELEILKKEKEVVNGKLAGLLTASKDLDNLIESQRSDKSKEGLGYTDVPPPTAQLYLSPKKDLSRTGLPECADDTVTDYSRPSPTVESSSEEDQNRNPSTSENVASPITPKSFIKFVKASKSQSKIPDFVMKKKACFNCGDFNHLAYECRKRVKKGTTRTSFNKSAHSYKNRPFQRKSAMRSQYRAPWVSTVNRNFPPINRKFSTGSRNFPTANKKFSTASRKFPAGSTKSLTANMGIKGKAGSSQNHIDDKGYWDSGCSRHMIGNISYLSDYESFDGGHMSFGQGGCKITEKGTIKTEYIVLGRDFKLLDDANILLRTPRRLGTKVDARKDVKKDVSSLRYIVLPNWVHEEHLESTSSQPQDACNIDAPESSFTVYQMDVKSAFLYGTIDEEVEFKALMHEKFQMSVMGELNFFLGLQVLQKEDGIFLSQDKEFEALMHENFQMSAMGELNLFLGLQVLQKEDGIFLSQDKYIGDILKKFGFLDVRSSNTPMDKENPWGKDEPRKDVELHLYRSMIGSLMYLTASRPMGFTVYQMYVESAFLYGTIDEEVYVMQPPGFQDPAFPAKVYKVEKAMYGLHQAPRAWQKEYFILVQVYVDDIIFGSSNPQLCREFEALMHEKFQMSAMGKLNFFLGLQVLQKEDGIFLSQDKYIRDILKKFGYSNVRYSNTPMDKDNPWGKDGTRKDIDLHLYRSMIGSLMYLTASRPDIMFAVCACARHQVTPKEWVRPIGTKWVLKNKKDERGIVIKNKARLVAQGHTQEEGIDYDEVFALVARIKAIRLFLAYASFMGFIVYQIDVKSAFFCEFEALMHEKFQMSAMGKLNFFLRLQVLQKKDGIFLSQNKYVGDILKKFRYSNVRSANTPMDKENPWGKDRTGKDVDLHLYRSMIGSLIYLNGHPKLGIWYPKESPFDLVAYSDSDYGGATQDRKSTTRGCQFLGRRLISWQCKKQTIVTTSTTDAEYVAAASGCGKFYGFRISCLIMDENVADLLTKPFDAGRFQYLVIVDFVEASHLRYALTINPNVYVSYIRQFWSTARIETTDEGTKILAIVDGKPRTISESSIRRNLKLKDEAGISSLPDAELFENLTLMGYNISPNQKFSFQKGQFSHQWKYLIHTIMQCLSPKSTGFNEFSSNIDTALVTEPIPTVIPTDTPQLKHYTRRARIAQSSALPTTADEPASPIRDDSQDDMASKITAQDLEISALKARIKHLEDRDGGDDDPSGEDATINGRRLETGDEAGIERSTEKDSDDTEEMANVITSLDASSVLTSGVQVSVPPAVEVATVSIPPAGEIPTISVPTGSGMVPTASPMFTTATESIPYTRRKGKKEYEQAAAELTIEEKIELINELVKYQDHLASILKYKAQQSKPLSRKQQRDFYMSVLRSHAEEGKRFKRKGLRLEHESAKKVKTSEEVSEKDLNQMIHLVPVEEVYVEALQHFDREDLNQLWALVKETLNIRQAASDKEKELWVELKRLYEPDVEGQLWTHTQTLMHDPFVWRLYDSCGVHHILSRDQEIFMLVEREYPLRKGLAIVMISNKLQVENYSQMASDLIQKIHKIANSPRHDGFPLPEEVPTASEEKFPLLKKRDATADKDCTANEDKGWSWSKTHL